MWPPNPSGINDGGLSHDETHAHSSFYEQEEHPDARNNTNRERNMQQYDKDFTSLPFYPMQQKPVVHRWTPTGLSAPVGPRMTPTHFCAKTPITQPEPTLPLHPTDSFCTQYPWDLDENYDTDDNLPDTYVTDQSDDYDEDYDPFAFDSDDDLSYTSEDYDTIKHAVLERSFNGTNFPDDTSIPPDIQEKIWFCVKQTNYDFTTQSIPEDRLDLVNLPPENIITEQTVVVLSL